MKTWSVVAVSFLLSFSSAHAQNGGDNGLVSPRDYRINNFSFAEIDFAPLLEEAQKRTLGLSPSELEKLIHSNFRFIFFNKVNKKNFLINPDPHQVVEKTVAILQLHERLEALIREGRKLAVGGSSSERKGQLVREIGDAAKKLGQIFRDYFLDLHPASYRLSFRSFETHDVQFVHYLIQSDRINRLLSQELDHYFFNPAPGAIDISEFDDYSVGILSESIVRLSSLTERNLR